MIEDKGIPANLHDFDTVKVVVFVEVAPLTDKFQQIMLTAEHRKAVLDAIEKDLKHEGAAFHVISNDDHEYTFPNITTDYTPEEIDRYKDETDE